MSAGRTYWLALDARWLAREGVVEAREEAGHAAVVVLIALMGQAKLENDGGRVKTGYRALAREAFLDGGAEEARRVVTLCHASGVIDDLEEHDDGKRFSCRLSGWVEDQTKGKAADRKTAQRERERAPIFERDGWRCVSCGSEDDLTIDHIIPRIHGGSDDESNLQTLCGTCNRKKGPAPANVTPGLGQSRPVTHGHVPVGTGQHSTGQALPSEVHTAGVRAAGGEKPKRPKPQPPNPDEHPADLPQNLRPAATSVTAVLTRVAAAKGAKPVTLAAVGRALATYPDHDHAHIAGEFEHFWVHGNFATRPLRDVVAAYRNRLKQLPAGTAARGHLAAVPTQLTRDEFNKVMNSRVVFDDDEAGAA